MKNLFLGRSIDTEKGMKVTQILDMIASNRQYIKNRSNLALQNLAMLHKSFDDIADERCILSLALNDSLSAMISGADYTGAIRISGDIIQRFPDSEHTLLMANHESVLGRSYTYLHDFDSAREHLNRAEYLAYSIEPVTETVLGLRADILHELAMCNHHADGDDKKTLDYLTRALREVENTDQSNQKGICLMGIANVNYTKGHHKESLEYHLKALPYFEEREHYTNLSTVLCNIGNCYTKLGQYESAEAYIVRALEIRHRLGTYWEIANCFYNLAILYQSKGDPETAYENMLAARDYAMVSQVVGVQMMILKELETMALAQGDILAAEQHREQRSAIQAKWVQKV